MYSNYFNPLFLRDKLGNDLKRRLECVIEDAITILRQNTTNECSIENDIGHSKRVEEIISRLIPNSDDYWDCVNAPTPFELYMLLSAVYLHDIEKWQGSENHEFRAAKRVESNPRDFGFSKNQARLVAEIIKAHADESKVRISDLSTNDGDKHNIVNVRFLGAVLRLADELDCDYQRVQGIEHLRQSIRESIHNEIIQPKMWRIKIGAEANTLRDKVKLELLEKKARSIIRTVQDALHPKGLFYHNIEVDVMTNIKETECEKYYKDVSERFDLDHAVNDPCGNNLLNNGIWEKNKWCKTEKKKDEVIRVLFMEKPVTITRELSIIKKDHGYGLKDTRKLCVDIRDVKYAAYNNPGRNGINNKCFSVSSQPRYNPSKTKEWAEEIDRKVHEFMLDANPKYDSIKFDLPMRWCSGGVFPIVTYKKNKYGMFFFRDIEPFGWQVPIGGSETTEEIANPDLMMWREFCEEFLVLKEHPISGKRIKYKKPELIGEGFSLDMADAIAKDFFKEHITLRKDPKYDDLDLCFDDSEAVKFKRIVYDSCIEIDDRDKHNSLKNVLFTVNPLELGIETIAVIETELADNDYLLDGEIIRTSNELARMPVALISLDYLKRNSLDKENAPFRKLEWKCKHGSKIPSIEGLPYEEGDVIVFAWDIKKRNEILTEEKKGVIDQAGNKVERDRYRGNWAKFFADLFYTDELISRPTDIPRLFTANAAKTACYTVHIMK